MNGDGEWMSLFGLLSDAIAFYMPGDMRQCQQQSLGILEGTSTFDLHQQCAVN